MALIGLGVFAPAAHAQYNPNTPGASVDDSTVSSGDLVTVDLVCDVPAGTNMVLYLDGRPVGSTLADDNGAGTIGFVINGAPGDYQITNSCNSAVLTITIVGATAGNLPRTGTDNSLPLAKIAIVLITAGGLLVVAARNRSNKATA